MYFIQVQHQQSAGPAPSQPVPSLPYPSAPQPALPSGSAYPTLGDYMGLELTEDVIRANMPEYLPASQVNNFQLCLLGGEIFQN